MRWRPAPAAAFAVILVLPLPLPLAAQSFTTAAEVTPILQMTRANWVAVREYEGQDLIYFTHLLSWRCGIAAITFSVNGGPEAVFPAEPCYRDEAQPNALKMTEVLPYAVAPLGSIRTVKVRLDMGDGSSMAATFDRAGVLID
jgi:hypothetical protein